jgi:hypothetical protein
MVAIFSTNSTILPSAIRTLLCARILIYVQILITLASRAKFAGLVAILMKMAIARSITNLMALRAKMIV